MTYRSFYKEICQFQNEVLIEECISVTTEKHFKKGEFLVHAGEPEPYLYFLIYGVCRGVIINEAGCEFTECFGYQCGTVARATSQLAVDIPAPISIESLEDSLYYCVPVTEALKLNRQYPEIGELWNRLLSEHFNRHWEAERAMHKYDAANRYKWFLLEYPGLADRISKKHIASFLGMDPSTLSRLRHNVSEA